MRTDSKSADMSLKTWADGQYCVSIGDEATIFDALNSMSDDRAAELLVNQLMLTVAELTSLCRTNQRANDVVCGSFRVWLLLLQRDFALAALPEDMVGRSDGEKAILSRSMQRYVIAGNQGGQDGVRDRAQALYRALYLFTNADGDVPIAASVDRLVRRDENQRLGADAGRLLIELSSAPIVRRDRVNMLYHRGFVALSLCTVPSVRDTATEASVLLADFVELMFDPDLFQPDWLEQRLVVAADTFSYMPRDNVVLNLPGSQTPPMIITRANRGERLLWPPTDAAAAPSFQRTSIDWRAQLRPVPSVNSPFLFKGNDIAFGFGPQPTDTLYGADERASVAAVGPNGQFDQITSIVGDYAMLQTIVDPNSADEADMELLASVLHLPSQLLVTAPLLYTIGNSRVHTAVLLDVDDDGYGTHVTVYRNNIIRELRVVFDAYQLDSERSMANRQTHEMRFPDIENSQPAIFATETHVLFAFGVGTVVVERPSKDFSRPPQLVADREDADRIAMAVSLRNKTTTSTCESFRNRRSADDAAATSSTKRQRSRSQFSQV